MFSGGDSLRVLPDLEDFRERDFGKSRLAFDVKELSLDRMPSAVNDTSPSWLDLKSPLSERIQVLIFCFDFGITRGCVITGDTMATPESTRQSEDPC